MRGVFPGYMTADDAVLEEHSPVALVRAQSTARMRFPTATIWGR